MTHRSLLVEVTQKQLGWPSREQILNPSGPGPAVYARLANEKIGKAISRLSDGKGVRVGVLVENSSSRITEAPLAVVCEFQDPVSLNTLREAHKLAWNFCRSPLLITIEPTLLRAWTCCEPPERETSDQLSAEISEVRFDPQNESYLAQQAARSLHWIQLISGQFFRDYSEKLAQRLLNHSPRICLAGIRPASHRCAIED